jgi:acyl-CoA thioester hydrolase
MSLRRPASEDTAFVHETVVHFDDLDPMGMLHNGRYPVLVERAVSAFFEHLGWRWVPDVAANPDQFHAVRSLQIEYVAPVLGPGPVEVAVHVAHLGTTSAVFGFAVRSASGVHAHGRRSVVKLDHRTLAPTPWTDRFRAGLAAHLVAEAA